MKRKHNPSSIDKAVDPFEDNTVSGFKDKDHALTPKVDPFRPDLSFEKDKSTKRDTVNRTTEW